jgi:hypothetical protein
MGADSVSELPPGFIIDDHAGLPPGFVVDGEKQAVPVTAAGLGKAAVGGLAQGATSLMGLPGDIHDLLNKGIDKGLGAIGINVPSARPSTFGSTNIQKGVESVTGEFYKPQNTAEKYVGTAASFVPGALAAPGGMASNAVRYGIGPGLASEAAGQAVGEGSKYEPYARAAAGIGAGLLNPERLVTPFPASPARQAAVDVLKNEGVTSLTAGQRTGSTPLRYLEDAASSATFAGQGVKKLESEAQHQFTEAALRRAGTSGAATPEVLAENQKRLGKAFEDLSTRNTLIPDNQMITDLTNAVAKYKNVPDSFERSQVQNVVNDIIPHINAGQMPGTEYQAMRHYLTEAAHSSNDSYFSKAMAGIRDSLDNAMGRSIAPEDAAMWKRIRKEYGAQEVIKKSASKAGEATAEGQISPPNLRNTVSSENRGNYALGRGPFAELARAGANVMTPLPNSGTAQRMGALQTLDNTLMAIPRAAAGRVVMNPLIQELLSNQALVGNLPNNPAAQNLLIAQMLQRSIGTPQKGQ